MAVWKRLSHENVLPFYGVDVKNFQLALSTTGRTLEKSFSTWIPTRRLPVLTWYHRYRPIPQPADYRLKTVFKAPRGDGRTLLSLTT